MIKSTRSRWIEIGAFAAILVLAAALRLGDLAVRGTWDADQGHDMLVLRALVLDGRIPLLGPPTSIGNFHHGVLYYFLLAPAALVSRADPVAVTTWIALGGIAAVAVTGWLARSIAGPIAGLAAALLLAVSASGVEESIFIWNPNVIALSSSVALAAAWQAWRSRRARWWVLAGVGAVVTMQGHVLGVILTPVIAALLIADWRRRRREGDRPGAAAVARAGLGWFLIALVTYVPLAIHELDTGGAEIRAVVVFLGGAAEGSSVALPVRLPIVGLRVLGWPLTGLLTDAPIATLLAATLVVGLAVWRGWLPVRATRLSEPTDERLAVRWLTLGLAWTIGALAVAAASLATVVPGLPNDHYHAFADPIVIVLVAVGLAGLIASGRVATVAAVVAVVALAGWNLTHQPPSRAADGGWQAARYAASRVIEHGGENPMILTGLPAFKSDEALRMPLEAAGAAIEPAAASDLIDPTATRVILCDQLFREAIGADCGGPAEDAQLASEDPGSIGPRRTLVDRFEAAPGRWISIYR